MGEIRPPARSRRHRRARRRSNRLQDLVARILREYLARQPSSGQPRPHVEARVTEERRQMMATYMVSLTVETAEDDVDDTAVEQAIRDMVGEQNWQVVSLLVVNA
jgi:hypothetical protein